MILHKTIYLYDIDDMSDPIELAFQVINDYLHYVLTIKDLQCM